MPSSRSPPASMKSSPERSTWTSCSDSSAAERASSTSRREDRSHSPLNATPCGIRTEVTRNRLSDSDCGAMLPPPKTERCLRCVLRCGYLPERRYGTGEKRPNPPRTTGPREPRQAGPLNIPITTAACKGKGRIRRRSNLESAQGLVGSGGVRTQGACSARSGARPNSDTVIGVAKASGAAHAADWARSLVTQAVKRTGSFLLGCGSCRCPHASGAIVDKSRAGGHREKGANAVRATGRLRLPCRPPAGPRRKEPCHDIEQCSAEH